MVAFRDHEALPRRSAHRCALARQPRYESIGSRTVWPDRTPQGLDTQTARAIRNDARTTFLARPASRRAPLASPGFYAGPLHRQSQPCGCHIRWRTGGSDGAPRRSRSSSCAMLSAAITAMRSVPLTLPTYGAQDRTGDRHLHALNGGWRISYWSKKCRTLRDLNRVVGNASTDRVRH